MEKIRESIEVEKGKFKLNKTRLYLLPIFKEYGEAFGVYLNSVFKLACGVGDIVLSKSGVNYNQHIFILLDTTMSREYFLKFLNWIRVQSYYEDDYVFGNISNSFSHMIVLKVPEKFKDLLPKFKKGKYSSMYSQEEISDYFKNFPKIASVLMRSSDIKPTFIKTINKIFGSNIEDFDIEDYELEFPPNKQEELF